VKSRPITDARREPDDPSKGRLITGVVWYTPKEWARVKAIAADPENFEDSYEAWAVKVAEGMGNISRKFGEVRPMNVTAEELLDWCRAHGRKVDSQSRVEYMMTLVKLQQEAVHAAEAGRHLPVPTSRNELQPRP
jgi:hypothetical protein